MSFEVWEALGRRVPDRVVVPDLPGHGESEPKQAPLPVGLLVARDGRSAWVAATMGDRVVQYDAGTLEPLRSIEVEGEPDGLASTVVLPGAPCHACTPQGKLN